MFYIIITWGVVALTKYNSFFSQLGHARRAHADRGLDDAVQLRIAQGGTVLPRRAPHGLSDGERVGVPLDGRGHGRTEANLIYNVFYLVFVDCPYTGSWSRATRGGIFD